jgi:hypothetical protein
MPGRRAPEAAHLGTPRNFRYRVKADLGRPNGGSWFSPKEGKYHPTAEAWNAVNSGKFRTGRVGSSAVVRRRCLLVLQRRVREEKREGVVEAMPV